MVVQDYDEDDETNRRGDVVDSYEYYGKQEYDEDEEDESPPIHYSNSKQVQNGVISGEQIIEKSAGKRRSGGHG